jgi:hypothetical protein
MASPSAVQCSAVQCSAVQCSAVQCSAVCAWLDRGPATGIEFPSLDFRHLSCTGGHLPGWRHRVLAALAMVFKDQMSIV